MPERLKHHTVRALRWSERYTKTDMVYFTSGSFWLFWSQTITSIVSFGMAVVFANLLSKDAYGLYKYLLTVLGVLTIACLRGMDAVVTQASARGNDQTVIQALAAKVRWGLLGSLASAGFAAYYFAHGNGALAVAFLIACVFIPIMDSFGIYSAVLTGKREFRSMVFIDVTSQLVAAMALIGALLLTHNPIVIFLSYCAAWTLMRLWGLVRTLRRHRPNGKHEAGAMSYGWHSSLINSSAVLISSLDSILVFHFLGAAQLAVYTFALAPILQMRGVLGIVTTLSTPKFATRSSAEIRKTIFDRSLALGLLGVVVVAIYVPFAPLFYKIFFHQYLDAVLFSQVFAVTVVISLGFSLLGGVLNSRITLIPKHYLYLWNIPSIVLALSSVLFIQVFGIWGAVAGQVLSSLTNSAVAWFLWRTIRAKELPPPLEA